MCEVAYDYNEKIKCWYQGICDGDKCGDEYCPRHYKMAVLATLATLEGNQRYTFKMIPSVNDVDAFRQLSEYKKDMLSFVSNGKNLLIYSRNTGNGKTSWSIRLLLSYLDSIWQSSDVECRALFISVPRLMSAMKENISKANPYYQYVNEHILKADLVVWDEINYKEWSPFEQDYVLNILSQRIGVGKSNIYTTNCSLEDIEKKLGTRLSSRIIGNSILIEFKGNDRRNSGGEL